ncbi:phosphotransferase [Cyanobium sp. T1B-Tous]|uniref:ecdysteroid 22-kinase family protein n=1 Tax=Cyanobium sp. T1B-Tous TaxID=2823721 RepID=UPI0020CE6FA8|nr:ecdysteroid 22-kinase family protein [Cyanobium sp. T1B-Tous]MCP9805495.1 phosphotransferase [Cyanobium sp. T1B-Tous]
MTEPMQAPMTDPVVKQPEPDWIGEVLGTTVKSLEAKLLGEARGFQSTTWRLELSCDPPGAGPASVILKSETSDQDFNAFSRLNNAFGREVGVYTHCTPRLSNHQPAVFATHAGEPSWLLMEDLTHLRSGDQVIGLSYQETLASIQRMAAIHAEFWMDPGLHQHDWLPNHGFWFSNPNAEIVEDFFATYGVRFGPDVCHLYRAVLEQTSAVDAAMEDRPWTLVHGDLRADNLLFAHTVEDPESVIIDWSWASRSVAAIDIAFLVGGSTPQAQRLGRHDDLLLAWHQELVNRGVRDYPLSEARYDMQLSALRCITAGVAMHGFSRGPDTPIRAALFMDDAIQRHAAYALEIDAWAALPDPSGFPLRR